MKKFLYALFVEEGLEGVLKKVIWPFLRRKAMPAVGERFSELVRTLLGAAKSTTPLGWLIWEKSMFPIKWTMIAVIFALSLAATIIVPVIAAISFPINFLLMGKRGIAEVREFFKDKETFLLWNAPYLYKEIRVVFKPALMSIFLGMFLVFLGWGKLIPTALGYFLPIITGVLFLYLGYRDIQKKEPSTEQLQNA